MMVFRIAALLTLITLPVMASGQTLTSTVELCSDPMTTGHQKLALLPGAGWTEVTGPTPEQFARLAGSLGPSFNSDMPVAEMQAILPQISAGLANAVSGGILQVVEANGALLMIGVNPQPNNGLEHLTCLFAGSATSEVAAYWQQYGGAQVTPLLGREITLFEGSVFNARDDITYSEYQVWARVPQALSDLTDTYRYERLQTASQ
jgi:hypothetical protein